MAKKAERSAEIAAEEAKYKGTSAKGGRKQVDGLSIYTAAEMEEEMVHPKESLSAPE